MLRRLLPHHFISLLRKSSTSTPPIVRRRNYQFLFINQNNPMKWHATRQLSIKIPPTKPLPPPPALNSTTATPPPPHSNKLPTKKSTSSTSTKQHLQTMTQLLQHNQPASLQYLHDTIVANKATTKLCNFAMQHVCLNSLQQHHLLSQMSNHEINIEIETLNIYLQQLVDEEVIQSKESQANQTSHTTRITKTSINILFQKYHLQPNQETWQCISEWKTPKKTTSKIKSKPRHAHIITDW